MSNLPQMGLQRHLVASFPKAIHLCLLCTWMARELSSLQSCFSIELKDNYRLSFPLVVTDLLSQVSPSFFSL